MAKPAFEYRMIPIHCRTDGTVEADSTECLNDAAEDGWRVVGGTLHQYGAQAGWRVLMEREK